MEIAIIGGGIVGCRLCGARTGDASRPAADRPFGNRDDFISQQELRALSDQYKRIAGYSIEDVAVASGQPAT
jgi:hypothetical protein